MSVGGPSKIWACGMLGMEWRVAAYDVGIGFWDLEDCVGD